MPSASAYDILILSASERHGVDPALIKAIIDKESRFNPLALRNEPAIQDASRGLMQILLRTARGEGFTGSPADLLNPEINIEYGTRYLKKCLRQAGNMAGAASAYNGGYRPTLGFGKPATRVLTVCLARDQQTGECIRSRTVQPGEYANQPYVDGVLDSYAKYHGTLGRPVVIPDLTVTASGGVTKPAKAAKGTKPLKAGVAAGAGIGVALMGLLGWLLFRR